MSINIPNKDQWQKMNEHLSNIAGALGTQIDTSTWLGIQKAVKAGVSPELFPIGTQLVVSHDTYGDMLYDVVAHDYLKPAKNKNAHTMTLMCHDCLPSIQFDNSEACYYAENELPAGTYNFTIDANLGAWWAGTYQFTTKQPIPVGGLLCISNIVDSFAKTYASQVDTTAIETVTVALGNGGTRLGAFGVELNDIRRALYGSNNYKESAIRLFLNSSAEAGSVWTPQTKFGRPPSWASSLAGFVNGLDPELVSVIGEVAIPCSANNIYESPDSSVSTGEQYTLNDKFYLPSQTEIFGNGVEDGSKIFPYYEGASNVDRIKYTSVATSWGTRTAHQSYSDTIQAVSADGSLSQIQSMTSLGITPVFTIV